MTTRNIKISIGEYYHIYNRGTDKRDIFMDKDDYERFPERVTFRNPLGELHTNLTPITLERIKNLGKKPDYNIRVYKSYKPGDKFP